MDSSRTNGKMGSHLIDAQVENARFLIDTCGLHPDRAAHRLGVTRDALDKLLERHRLGARNTDTDSVTDARSSA